MKTHVKRLAVGIVVVIAVAALTFVLAAAQSRGTPAGPAYSLATLYRNLQCCSQAWVGRTVLARGKIALMGRVYIPPALTTYRTFMTLVPSTVDIARPNGGRLYTGPQLQATPQYRASIYWTVLEWLRGVASGCPIAGGR